VIINGSQICHFLAHLATIKYGRGHWPGWEKEIVSERAKIIQSNNINFLRKLRVGNQVKA